MGIDQRQAFIKAVAAEHGPRLKRYLLARVRNTADAADLVQEVYLRLLRVDNLEAIRMPEAYVFALANHVLYQFRLRRTQGAEPVELLEVLTEAQVAFANDPLVHSETQQRIEELEAVLNDLSPKARAALVLHRRDGLTLEQIAAQLGVSRPMVKKYLAKALFQCRNALDGG